MIAAAGLLAVQLLNVAWADAAASMLIGVVLAITAAALAREPKSLMTGEAASAAVTAKVRATPLRDPAVERVSNLTSMHFGPNDILAAACIGFRNDVALEHDQRATASLENQSKSSIPAITRVYLSLSTRPAELRNPPTVDEL